MPKYDKLFLIGVSDVRFYSDAQLSNLVAVSKTDTNTTIEVTNSSQDINGGKGNKLLYRFFTTGMVNLTFTDTVFNLNTIGQNLGESVAMGFNTRHSENVTLVGYNGTLTGTPVGINGGNVLVYYSYNGKEYLSPVPANNKQFTIGVADQLEIPSGATICASYYATNNAAEYVTIPAQIIPNTVYCVMDADLCTSETGDGLVGKCTIVIPRMQFSGTQTINMTSDGYATQDLTGTALAWTPAGNSNACASSEIYGYIIQEINDTNWYDGVKALIVPAITMGKSSTAPLNVWAFNGATSWLLTAGQMAGLTITPTGTGITYANGIITTTASATSGSIAVAITSKPAITDTATITVTA